MLRKNKWKILISSVITVLPILYGFIVWNRLPERVATHWGADGNPDGYSGRLFAVIGLPLIILGAHWLCLIMTSIDPKNKEQNRKVFSLVFWLCPAISVVCSAAVYITALGSEFNIGGLFIALMGVMFIAIGNYFPKCKPNYTIGIKIPWTLESEENWYATHRFAGKLSVIGGIVLLPLALLPIKFLPVIMLPVLVIAFAPMIYSYRYYKNHK